MESDLAAVDRALHPWVIAVVHRPLYTSCLNHKEQSTMQQQFGDLFLAHKVDVVLSGHVHSYERTWPTMGGYSNVSNATSQVYPDRSVYVDPRYPVYVVSGAAGNGESVDNCTCSSSNNPVPQREPDKTADVDGRCYDSPYDSPYDPAVRVACWLPWHTNFPSNEPPAFSFCRRT